jgi:hypothetical protein
MVSWLRDLQGWDQIALIASLEKAKGECLSFRQYGLSKVLTVDVAADVWQHSSNLSFLSSAERLSIVSTSANDAVGGTGASYILVDGVDNDYGILSEAVILTGTTPVLTTNSFLRVNRIRVVASGSTKANVGVITATAQSAATVQGYVAAAYGISQQSFFTVPAGYTAFSLNLSLSAFRTSGGSAATRTAEVIQQVYIPSINTIYDVAHYGVSNLQPFRTQVTSASQTPAQATLWFIATADVANTAVSTAQEIIILKGDFNTITYF